MLQQQRQQLHSILAHARLADIQRYWAYSLTDFEYTTLRGPETGMVMAVARADGSGDPFNLGEVTVTRCALKLPSGETGVGYVMGSDRQHALHVALLDALAQSEDGYQQISRDVLGPLWQQQELDQQEQTRRAATTKVDFLTMVRGEDA